MTNPATPNQSGLVLTGGGKVGGASTLSGAGPFDKLRTMALRQAQDHGPSTGSGQPQARLS